MEETKHKIKMKRHPRRNWQAAAACLLSIALLVCLSAQYLSFVSKTIYAESTAHLEEVLHKSSNMLSMIVKKNISYLHVWNGFLSSDPDDASTQAYLESAQQQLGFAEFYFLSYDGNYMTPSGETGYLGLQSNLDELLSDQEDVVLNTALPGQDPMLVFICPETKGIYRGFAYDAIAISHYNNVVMKTVDDSAFGGAASSFVIYPDGQVVIENISEDSESIYNFIAILQEYSDLTEAQIQELTDDFAQGITGNREVTLDGTRFYMVYESTGIQNWILVGLVPRDTVNAAMNQLWQRTMQIVALVVLSIAAMVLLMVMHRGRTKLRRQNTAILYRDVLFEKLSQNVDDVFLLLDAQKHRADYVSPNIERLLGLTMKRCARISARWPCCTRRISPAAPKIIWKGLPAATSANGTRSLSIRKPGSIAGSMWLPWAARSRAKPSTFWFCLTAPPTGRRTRRSRMPWPPPKTPTAPRAPSFPICPTTSAPR